MQRGVVRCQLWYDARRIFEEYSTFLGPRDRNADVEMQHPAQEHNKNAVTCKRANGARRQILGFRKSGR